MSITCTGGALSSSDDSSDLSLYSSAPLASTVAASLVSRLAASLPVPYVDRHHKTGEGIIVADVLGDRLIQIALRTSTSSRSISLPTSVVSTANPIVCSGSR